MINLIGLDFCDQRIDGLLVAQIDRVINHIRCGSRKRAKTRAVNFNVAEASSSPIKC